jgi:AAA15 family ATPase/GTPase
MYISQLHLKNFKRFTDLAIDLSGLKVPSRLVLLVGVNGSGKSSIFDAFSLMEANVRDGLSDRSRSYCVKDSKNEVLIESSGQNKSEYILKIQKEKDKMLVDIASRLFESRKEYAYFKESDQKRRKIFVENKAVVLETLKLNDFETFYKVFSMKDCSGEIRPQNIKKDVLVNTLWFKNQIQNILTQKI